eukprot:14880490-Heterocapsa_arctica.AAC.1
MARALRVPLPSLPRQRARPRLRGMAPVVRLQEDPGHHVVGGGSLAARQGGASYPHHLPSPAGHLARLRRLARREAPPRIATRCRVPQRARPHSGRD